ncbi:MAG: hypothetical protein M3373_14480 [Gemmatimonadota bacterium]|nr:hypothetical protein [Gemmatimonadota bacterium]
MQKTRNHGPGVSPEGRWTVTNQYRCAVRVGGLYDESLITCGLVRGFADSYPLACAGEGR